MAYYSNGSMILDDFKGGYANGFFFVGSPNGFSSGTSTAYVAGGYDGAFSATMQSFPFSSPFTTSTLMSQSITNLSRLL